MSRLDLLKQNTSTSSSKSQNSRNMGEPDLQKRDDDYGKQYFNKRRDGERRDDDNERRGTSHDIDKPSIVDDYSNDNEQINVIELDIDGDIGDIGDMGNLEDLGKTLELETEEDLDNNEKEAEKELKDISEKKPKNKTEETKKKKRAADHESAEIIRYSKDDIKLELEYLFEHREDAFKRRVKSIIGGGLEISTDKILQLDNVVRLTVEIEELRERIICEGRIISVFPRNIRSEDKENPYSYIVQLVGEFASDLDKVLAKYLLGYKMK